MSAAGHADAGNVTQDDDMQADDDYDDGLDNFHQTAALNAAEEGGGEEART